MRDYIFVLVAVAILIIIAITLFLKKTRKKTIQKLVYSRTFSENGAFEGDTVIMTETIYNPSFLPVFRLDMEYYVFEELKIEGYEASKKGSMQYCISRFNLLPFMQIQRTHVIRLKKRGYYKLDTASVYTNKDNVYFEAPCDIYVYPRQLDMNIPPSPMNLLQGDVTTTMRLVTDPFSFDGVRDYRVGDPFNSINFKQTAKAGKLMVNNREYSSSRLFKVFLNFDAETKFDLQTSEYESMMEQALSFASYLIDEAIRFGYKVGLSSNCVLTDGRMKLETELAGGDDHFEYLLREMAMMRPRTGASFASILKKGVEDTLTMAEIYIFTVEVTEAMENYIYDMRRSGNSINVVLLRPKEDGDE